MSDVLARLAAPFPPDAVSWRVGSMTKDKSKARALAYLDARDVMDRLDSVLGASGWQCEYIPMPNGTTCCRIALKLDGEWVWKANGAGNTDIEAEKGAYSDAFKRAAVLWGVGRYLYAIDSPWVKLDEWKQIAKEELPRLRALLPGAAPQKSKQQARSDGDWKKLADGLRNCATAEDVDVYLDEHAQMIAEMPAGWQRHWTDMVGDIRATVARSVAA